MQQPVRRGHARVTLAAVLVGGALAAALVSAALPGTAGAAPSHPRTAAGTARPGAAAGAVQQEPPTPAQCVALTGGRCLDPAGLQAAYDLNGLYAGGTTGAGVTIGIVDSFGSPTIARDLAVYDRQYGLPAIDLQVITPAGPPPPFDRGNSDMVGWADETTLDVEVAHTVAPGAKILLVETPTSETEGLAGFPDIVTAENYVIGHRLVDVLSQSFAATEATFTSPAQVTELSGEVYPAARAAGVTILSASGDSGPTDLELDQKTLYTTPQTDWPASDPLVTAVGGTMLDIGPAGTRAGPDAAWGGQSGGGAGGGGRSTIFPRPSFQSSVAAVVGDRRGVPDISLDAAPSSGLITYGSYDATGWSIGGGTSQASPLMAGIVALADQQAKGRVGYLNDVLYGTIAHEARGGIVDVTAGSNDLVDDSGAADPVPGYRAAAGYDLATGLGTIDGGLFVPALVAATAGTTQPLGSAGAAAPSPTPPPAATGTAGTPPSGAGNTLGAAVAPHRSSHTAEIVGAILAGVLLVLVAGGVLILVTRRRRAA